MKTLISNHKCPNCKRIGYWYQSDKVLITDLTQYPAQLVTKFFDTCTFCSNRWEVSKLTVDGRELMSDARDYAKSKGE